MWSNHILYLWINYFTWTCLTINEIPIFLRPLSPLLWLMVCVWLKVLLYVRNNTQHTQWGKRLKVHTEWTFKIRLLFREEWFLVSEAFMDVFLRDWKDVHVLENKNRFYTLYSYLTPLDLNLIIKFRNFHKSYYVKI